MRCPGSSDPAAALAPKQPFVGDQGVGGVGGEDGRRNLELACCACRCRWQRVKPGSLSGALVPGLAVVPAASPLFGLCGSAVASNQLALLHRFCCKAEGRRWCSERGWVVGWAAVAVSGLLFADLGLIEIRLLAAALPRQTHKAVRSSAAIAAAAALPRFLPSLRVFLAVLQAEGVRSCPFLGFSKF